MRHFRWVALVCVAAMLVVACGRSDTEKGGGSTPTTTAGKPSPTSGSFGTSGMVCKPGSPWGSQAQGVTPTEIRIGTMADPGFAGRPGLDQELFDAATVFSKWCNDAGGINGRKIRVDLLDSALTNVKASMAESCAHDFMLVGGGAVFDQNGVTTRLDCLLPEISGYSVSPAGQWCRPAGPAGPQPNTTSRWRLQVPRREVPGRDQGIRHPHR